MAEFPITRYSSKLGKVVQQGQDTFQVELCDDQKSVILHYNQGKGEIKQFMLDDNVTVYFDRIANPIAWTRDNEVFTELLYGWITAIETLNIYFKHDQEENSVKIPYSYISIENLKLTQDDFNLVAEKINDVKGIAEYTNGILEVIKLEITFEGLLKPSIKEIINSNEQKMQNPIPQFATNLHVSRRRSLIEHSVPDIVQKSQIIHLQQDYPYFRSAGSLLAWVFIWLIENKLRGTMSISRFCSSNPTLQEMLSQIQQCGILPRVDAFRFLEQSIVGKFEFLQAFLDSMKTLIEEKKPMDTVLQNIAHYFEINIKLYVLSSSNEKANVNWYLCQELSRPLMHIIYINNSYILLLYPKVVCTYDGFYDGDYIAQGIDSNRNVYPWTCQTDLDKYLQEIVDINSATVIDGHKLVRRFIPNLDPYYQSILTHGFNAAQERALALPKPDRYALSNYTLKFNLCQNCNTNEIQVNLSWGHRFCIPWLKSYILASTGGKVVEDLPFWLNIECDLPIVSSQLTQIFQPSEILDFTIKNDQRLGFARWQCWGRDETVDKIEYLDCHKIWQGCVNRVLSNGQTVCPACGVEAPKLNEYANMTKKCAGCYELKSVYIDFLHYPDLYCKKYNELLCKECLPASYFEWALCDEPTSQENQSLIISLLNPSKPCNICEASKSLAEFFGQPSCACSVWNDWVIQYCNRIVTLNPQNWDICAQCGIQLSEQQRAAILPYVAVPEPDPLYSCDICLEEFRSRDHMTTLEWDHYFWKECISEYMLAKINEKDFSKNGIVCWVAGCGHPVDGNIIAAHVDEKTFTKYNLFMTVGEQNIIECPFPDCGLPQEIHAPGQRFDLRCVYCKQPFCTICKKPPHPDQDCQQAQKLEERKLIEQTGEIASQCPNCQIVYFKDEACEHVTCANPKCKTDFWFTCSAIRSPIIAHGNHYHRPQCKWYGSNPENDDKYTVNWTEWVKRGRLCKPPKNLKRERTFI